MISAKYNTIKYYAKSAWRKMKRWNKMSFYNKNFWNIQFWLDQILNASPFYSNSLIVNFDNKSKQISEAAAQGCSLGNGVLKICSKFTGKHSSQSVTSIKLPCSFIETTLRHGCSPVNLLHISRTPFLNNISGRLLPKSTKQQKHNISYLDWVLLSIDK